MTTKILKATSKGQITLPKKWRDRFDTENFKAEIAENQIVIKPIKLSDDEQWETIFDADRDNNGEGVPVNELIKILKKIANE